MAHNPKKSRLEEPSKIDKVIQALDEYGARLNSDFTVPQPSAIAIEPLLKLIRPGRYLAQRSFASSSDLPTMQSSPDGHARESLPLAFVGIDLENEDEDEDIGYGGGDVVSFNGTLVPISKWLGDDFSSFINTLHSLPPAKPPQGILTTPHEWQLTAASRMVHLARSPYRGGILGDAMGMGKTLGIIIAMIEGKGNRSGYHVVVTTKGAARQWIDELEKNFAPGYQLRAFLLQDSRTPATTLLQYDVVVCTYEFLYRQHAALLDFELRFEKFKDRKGPMPKRPILSLYSGIFNDLDYPIIYLVLDEAQKAKSLGAFHSAIKALPHEATLMLSGTFCDNQFYDVFGLLDFLKGHPILSPSIFKEVFASQGKNGAIKKPTPIRIRRLQKFLLSLVVARPGRLLELQDQKRTDVQFSLSKEEEGTARDLWNEYLHRKWTSGGQDPFGSPELLIPDEVGGSEEKRKTLLGILTRALQAAMHPMLSAISDDEASALDEELAETLVDSTDLDNGNSAIIDTAPEILELKGNIDQVAEVPSTKKTLTEEEWRERIEKDGNALKSSRVRAFLKLYDTLRREFPEERIVVFSVYRHFLDIIEQALKLHNPKVHPLRYDGTKTADQREFVRKEFEQQRYDQILLITAGAGGVGLNLTSASIVIQTEVWWNHHWELQAYARAHRKGQSKTVKVYRLIAKNSPMDGHIKKRQRIKTKVIDKLAQVLVRADNEPPVIPFPII